MSIKQAREIAAEFSFVFSIPQQTEYISYSGIRSNAEGDHYIHVTLIKPLPLDFDLPAEYKGLSVIATEVTGEGDLGEP